MVAGRILCVLVVGMVAAPAFSDGSFHYAAQISSADMTNSRGAFLVDVPAILQQDRANIHRYKTKEAGDNEDSFFADFATRVQMPELYQPGPHEAELESVLKFVSAVEGSMVTLHVEVCLQDGKPVRFGVQDASQQHQIC